MASRRRPSGAAPLGVELDAEQPSARDRRDERRAVLGRARTTSLRAVCGHARVGVDEIEVGTVGDARRTAGARASARPGSSRCAGSVGASSRRDSAAGQHSRGWSAPSSSLPSNRSWSPRQIPRNGRSARDPVADRIDEAATLEAGHRRRRGADPGHDERVRVPQTLPGPVPRRPRRRRWSAPARC